jgi:ATP-dependent protease HslVU (ClpYQ) peptidase subunit
MTIITAYYDGDKHWIASDSYSVAGYSCFEQGTKLITKGDYILGFSASYRVADVITESDGFPKTMRGLQDLRKFRDRLKELLITDGAKKEAEAHEVIQHPVLILIISTSGVFHIDADYQIHKIHQGWYAIGSGQGPARGSLYTSKQLGLEDGKKAVQLAVKSATKHITTCGGKCHVKSVGEATDVENS